MLAPNTMLQGRYQIIEPIGRGGMGAVYRAIDTRLRCTVALKETLVEGDAPRRAFEREAQLLAGLRHPTLPKVSDHFNEGEGQFLVMEYITGDDLGTLLMRRESPFAPAEVLRWADTLLDALEYLHGHKPPIIHRDIKPQNMKLTERGEIILLDFGLAKGAAAATRSASTGSIFGYTPHYAPLEQIQGTGTDPRSDLYALAATLYHLLTGTPPPDALTRAAARINDDPDPLQPANQLNAEVSASVASVLHRAMSQKPDQRYPTAVAMRSALRDAARGGSVTVLADAPATPDPDSTMVMVGTASAQAARPGATVAGAATASFSTGTTMTPAAPVPAAPRRDGRPAWLLPAAGLGVLVVIAGLIFALTGGRGAPPPPPPTTAAQGGGLSTAATEEPTSTAAPTAAPLSEQQILETAVVLQTREAQQRADELATARALVNAVDGAQTQTAIALTPTPTALPPTEAPTEAPTTGPTEPPPPTNTRGPTNTPGPTRTPGPPTATPPPAAAPTGQVLVNNTSGDLFRGTARRGDNIDPAQGNGGSCIQGRVAQADGSLFQSFYVQVDNRGRTTAASHFYDTGNYRICGLAAGEWGVAVYAVNNQPTSGAEQAGHQVRVQLSGQPGEIFYVDFRASSVVAVPTEVPTPTPVPPTATPLASPYDGDWSGPISGKTAGDVEFNGRFRMQIRGGAIYSIAVDGPSCLFETYPNFPNGLQLGGTSFALSGSPFNPVTGGDASINFSIQGNFVSTERANGLLNASQNGASCAVATWSANRR